MKRLSELNEWLDHRTGLPTAIRNSATGLTYGVGRLANAFGPFAVAALYAHYGYASVFVYIATSWILVAIAVGGFGPLTRGKILA